MKVTGATTHFVSEEIDGGSIVLQEAVMIQDGDTVKGIAQKVLEVEHRILSKTVKAYVEGVLIVKNNSVLIWEEK